MSGFSRDAVSPEGVWTIRDENTDGPINTLTVNNTDILDYIMNHEL